MQNWTILASAVPEISLGASKIKVRHVTQTMPFLRVICHPLKHTETYPWERHSSRCVECWQKSVANVDRHV